MTADLFDVAAERIVLGAMMLDPAAAAELAGRLHPDDFYQRRHAVVFGAILANHAGGVPVDPVAVARRLAETRELGPAGGAPYLAELLEAVPTSATAGWHADVIARLARARRVRETLARALRVLDETHDGQRAAAELAELGDTPAATSAGLVDQITAALVDAAGLDAIPDPVPLVRGLIFLDSLTWLAGRAGHGKSFVALDIAGAVGSGEGTWQGYPVCNGPVLYVVAEGVSGVKQRVRAWETAMGHPMAGVTFLPMAVQSSNATAWQALTDVAQRRAVALVVLDTQARITVGMDENSNKDMGLLVERLDQLRRATGATVLVLHHQGRNGDHMRGATALDAGSTTVIQVEKSGDVITLSCDPEKGGKQKDAPEFDPINLRLIPAGTSAVVTLTDRPLATDTHTPAVRAMLSQWWEVFESDPVSVKQLTDTKVCTSATFHRAKRSLVKAGVMVPEGKGNAVRYHLPKAPND